jgi:hypothetical protein
MPTPKQLAIATAALIEGKSQNEAAKMIGMSRQGMMAHIDKDQIQQIIQDNQRKIINEAVGKAVQNQINKITLSGQLVNQALQGEDMPACYKTYADLGHDAEKQLLTSVGIHPSHTQSAQYLSLTQVNLEISPEVAKLLSFDRLTNTSDDDVITVDNYDICPVDK